MFKMIKVLREDRTGDELILDLQLSPDYVPEFAAQALDAVAHQENIKPDGTHTIRELTEEKIGKSVADELICGAVMNMAAPFGRSLTEGVSTVGMPRFANHSKLEPGKPFFFSASWAMLPQIELSSYDPVEIVVPPEKVPDRLIDDSIQQLLNQGASFMPCEDDSVIEIGDVVDLSLDTTLHGKKIEGLCFPSRVFTTGVGNMPEEFEQNIIGMKAGETKAFTYEGPIAIGDDDRPTFERYESTATIVSKLKKEIPPLTDAWVKTNVVGCETVSDLRDRIKSELSINVGQERQHYLNYRAASALAQRYDGPIPDAAYEAISEQIRADFAQQASYAGVDAATFMKSQGMTEEQFSVRVVLETHEKLAQMMAVDAMARHLGLSVDEDDLEAFYASQAPNGNAKAYRQQIEGSGRSYLATEGALRFKTSKYLVDHAVIREGNPYENAGI